MSKRKKAFLLLLLTGVLLVFATIHAFVSTPSKSGFGWLDLLSWGVILLCFRLLKMADALLPPRNKSASTRRQPRRARAGSGPFSLAECFFRFLPDSEREAILGDLEEEYRDVLREHGARAALRSYCGQILRSVLPLLVTYAFGRLREAVRRFIS